MATVRDPKQKCTRETCPWPHCECKKDEYPHAREITAAPKGVEERTAPGCYRCKPTQQHGFDTIQLGLYIVAFALAALAVWRVSVWFEGAKTAAYDRGVIDTKAAADEDRRKRDVAVGAALDVLAKKAGAAEAEAAKNKANWLEARNAARGKQLGSCEGSGQDQAPAAGGTRVAGQPSAPDPGAPGVARVGAPDIRLLWRFVGLYDVAHLADDGKPLFAASAKYASAPERADAASPYGLGELIDNHGPNAQRWSDCRRDLNDAIDKVEAAEAAFERGKK